jgi:hypothetical protein
LRPGGLKVVGVAPFNYRVIGADGQPVGEVSSAVSRIALPPGKYELDTGGEKISIELVEGRDLEISVR